MVRIIPLIIGFKSSAICVSSSSFDFVLSSLNLDSEIQFDTYSLLKYNGEGIVGLYADCDTCYNFTGLITDEGYFEITESSEGVFANSRYLNIDQTTVCSQLMKLQIPMCMLSAPTFYTQIVW